MKKLGEGGRRNPKGPGPIKVSSVATVQNIHLNKDIQRPWGISPGWQAPSLHGIGCRFPLWPNHAAPTFEFCDKKRVSGRSYCAEHLACCITISRAYAGQDVRFDGVGRANR